ncbi:hypothetical protein B0H66DRAFT_530255 [Apodospora peruviana]|uniref:Uncharacterized protein n=1 Tax=Apodospora peruviana TaxID=516989 RepID=A0AAE0IJF2_9PEZI|nr:hypothetical protein B0H66DRAFT_530255 [Apodospora peruviana]
MDLLRGSGEASAGVSKAVSSVGNVSVFTASTFLPIGLGLHINPWIVAVHVHEEASQPQYGFAGNDLHRWRCTRHNVHERKASGQLLSRNDRRGASDQSNGSRAYPSHGCCKLSSDTDTRCGYRLFAWFPRAVLTISSSAVDLQPRHDSDPGSMHQIRVSLTHFRICPSAGGFRDRDDGEPISHRSTSQQGKADYGAALSKTKRTPETRDLNFLLHQEAPEFKC